MLYDDVSHVVSVRVSILVQTVHDAEDHVIHRDRAVLTANRLHDDDTHEKYHKTKVTKTQQKGRT